MSRRGAETGRGTGSDLRPRDDRSSARAAEPGPGSAATSRRRVGSAPARSRRLLAGAAAITAAACLLAVPATIRARDVIVRGTAIAPDAPGAAPTPTPRPVPQAVSERLAWARRTLASSGLERLDRTGGALSGAIAAGQPFPVVRARAQREVASRVPSLEPADVSAAALLVLALRAGDLDSDLRRLDEELRATESAERKLDETSRELRARIAATGTRRSPRARSPWRSAASMRAGALERATTTYAHLPYAKAPTIPPIPAAGAAVPPGELETLLRESDVRRAAAGRTVRVSRERLRLFEERRAKFVEALSDAIAGTAPPATLSRNLG